MKVLRQILERVFYFIFHQGVSWDQFSFLLAYQYNNIPKATH